MAKLTLVSGNGAGSIDAVEFTGPTPAFPVFVQLLSLNIGVSTGAISVDTSTSFAAPIAQYSGALPTSGPYAVPNVPANPPDVEGLVVTITLSPPGQITQKIYRYDPTVTEMRGAIVDCTGAPRAGIALEFDLTRPDGSIEPYRLPRLLSAPADDVIVSRHQVGAVTDPQGGFSIDLQSNTRIAPPPTKYVVTIRDHPPERFLVELPEDDGPVEVEDLLE